MRILETPHPVSLSPYEGERENFEKRGIAPLLKSFSPHDRNHISILQRVKGRRSLPYIIDSPSCKEYISLN